ncbi:MAG: glycosyltransferase, partial [Xanthomonadales bacterium]|nr:glycosyltransferase [Xanthomonadales bacterium]
AVELNALVDQRTRWAESEKKALASARKERAELMARGKQLEAELKERAARIEAQNTDLRTMAEARKTTERQLREQARLFAAQSSRYAHLQSQHQRVIDSRSWRLTRPLRVARRLPEQMRRFQVWNPLRWPVLFSQLVRSVKTVGWRGVAYRLQRSQPPQAGPSTTVPVTETPVLKAPDLPAALPCSPSPRVSIIIPAYNELAYTAACLKSIANSPCDTAFEVIVVDDESSDETAATLSELEGLRFLRNEQNQGFIRSCNRGAAEARGDYVLFLNNDTQVQPGWLDTLLATFEQYPEAGLVGARLVYPDGTLQECGGMVFSDGSGWNYGRGDHPDRPEYQAVREVDYCSGACIALPSVLWQELGGFDEHYAPAYYEDTDLAFKVRAAGRKVYVQPATTVVHFEGISSGTDLTSGTKRYQVINREKFEQRWAEALKQQPAPIVNPDDLAEVRRARDHRLAGRILIIDAYTPEPDQDSGSVRLVNLMRCLVELGHGVCFLADNRAWAGRYTQDLQALGVECWYAPWAENTEAFFAEAGSSFDQVIISRHYIACNYTKLLEQYAPQADFIFDTVDLHYLREERLAELEQSTALRQVAKQTRRSELAMIRAADATLVVS